MSWLPVVVTVAPASEPVTLDEAKTQCRVDGTVDDALLTNYIATARTLVEQYTGTKLVSQTVELRCSRWCDLYDLPLAPIASVTSVSYLDTEGASQTLDASVYETVLIGLEPIVRLKVNQSWPAIRCVADAITVTATAGYSPLPATIKHAMLMVIAQWYDERSSVPSARITADSNGLALLPNAFDALLANYRRF